MKHVLSYSGGKDSTAMYLLAVEWGIDFLPVFDLTLLLDPPQCSFLYGLCE